MGSLGKMGPVVGDGMNDFIPGFQEIAGVPCWTENQTEVLECQCRLTLGESRAGCPGASRTLGHCALAHSYEYQVEHEQPLIRKVARMIHMDEMERHSWWPR